MLSVGGADLQGTDPNLLPGLHLGHVPEPASLRQMAASAWHDYRCPLAEPLEGGQVEVIEVQVRHDNSVNASVLREIANGGLAPKVGYAAAQDRVGKQPHPVKVQEHCVVGISGVDERPIPITENVSHALPQLTVNKRRYLLPSMRENVCDPHMAAIELPGADGRAGAVDAVLYVRRRRNQ